MEKEGRGGGERKGKEKRERVLKQAQTGPFEVRSLKLHPCLPGRWQGPKHHSHHLGVLAGSSIRSKVSGT